MINTDLILTQSKKFHIICHQNYFYPHHIQEISNNQKETDKPRHIQEVPNNQKKTGKRAKRSVRVYPFSLNLINSRKSLPFDINLHQIGSFMAN